MRAYFDQSSISVSGCSLITARCSAALPIRVKGKKSATAFFWLLVLSVSLLKMGRLCPPMRARSCVIFSIFEKPRLITTRHFQRQHELFYFFLSFKRCSSVSSFLYSFVEVSSLLSCPVHQRPSRGAVRWRWEIVRVEGQCSRQALPALLKCTSSSLARPGGAGPGGESGTCGGYNGHSSSACTPPVSATRPAWWRGRSTAAEASPSPGGTWARTLLGAAAVSARAGPSLALPCTPLAPRTAGSRWTRSN